ncbi:hypothetical protein AURDEDRAFT_174590 [Auricularia subglabra TFB-10046 SS5]|uniref:Uncharacterized protein n=1 Tax=Auricularia subglabra (strain TFB-10046 / SS5) TaxID=717982 RepID=J0CYF7_AURST|nr:hypothetical protein AURDEDRAFT_174590 [Auricularia subglabra TFB-10046 SS5]
MPLLSLPAHKCDPSCGCTAYLYSDDSGPITVSDTPASAAVVSETLKRSLTRSPPTIKTAWDAITPASLIARPASRFPTAAVATPSLVPAHAADFRLSPPDIQVSPQTLCVTTGCGHPYFAHVPLGDSVPASASLAPPPASGPSTSRGTPVGSFSQSLQPLPGTISRQRISHYSAAGGATRPASNLRFSGTPPTRISRTGALIPPPQRDVVKLTAILLPFSLNIGDFYFPIHPAAAQTLPRPSDASPTFAGLDSPVNGQPSDLDRLSDDLHPYGLVWDFDFEKLKPASLSVNAAFHTEIKAQMQRQRLDFAGPGFVARHPADSSSSAPPHLPAPATGHAQDWVFVQFNKVLNQPCHSLEPVNVPVDKQSLAKIKKVWRYLLRSGRNVVLFAPLEGYVTAQVIPDIRIPLQAIPVSSPHHCFPWYPVRAMTPTVLLPAPDPCLLICASIYNLNNISDTNTPTPLSSSSSAPPRTPPATAQRPRPAPRRGSTVPSASQPSPSVLRNAAQPVTLVSRSLANRIVRGLSAASSVTVSPSRPIAPPPATRPVNDASSDVIVLDSDDDTEHPSNQLPAPAPVQTVPATRDSNQQASQYDTDIEFTGFGLVTLHNQWRTAVHNLLSPGSHFDLRDPFRFIFNLDVASGLTAGAGLVLLLNELASASPPADPYTPHPALIVRSPTWEALVSPNPMSFWKVGDASGDGVRRSVILEAFDHLFHDVDRPQASFTHWEQAMTPNTYHPYTPPNGETSARQKYFKVAGMLSALALLYVHSVPRLERYFMLYSLTSDVDIILDLDLMSKLLPAAADQLADWPKDFQSPITSTRSPLNRDYLAALLIQLNIPMDAFSRRTLEDHDLYTRQAFSLLTLGAVVSPRRRPPEFDAFIDGLSQPLNRTPDSSMLKARLAPSHSFASFSRHELGVLVDSICQAFPSPVDFKRDLFSIPTTPQSHTLSVPFFRALTLYLAGHGHPDGIDQELIDQAKTLKAAAMSQQPSLIRSALFAQSIYTSPTIPVSPALRIITLRFVDESTFIVLSRDHQETLTPRQRQEALRLQRSAARTHGIPILFRTCFREMQIADTVHLQDLLKSYTSYTATSSLAFDRWMHSQVLTSTSDYSIL